MATRKHRAQVAQQTLSLFEQGRYIIPDGREVSIRDELNSARSRSVVHAPDDFDAIVREAGRIIDGRGERPGIAFEVANETTLHAAGRLLREGGFDRVLALNFASAKESRRRLP